MKKIATFGILGLLIVGLVTAAGFGFNTEAKTAIENDDFDGWKEAKIASLTEERFEQAKDRHADRQARHEEMGEILDQGYDAWLEFTSDKPCKNEDIITEDNFDQFVEMHDLRNTGDFEGADAIAEELGLEKGRKGHGKGKGMGRMH